MLKARPSGRGWQARCPAHDDRRPSLHIAEGDGGKVLLNCFADCTFDEVCAAMGVRPEQLFPPKGSLVDRPPRRRRQKEPRRAPAPTYTYQNEDGSAAFGVLRTRDKKFFHVRPDGAGGWLWGRRDVAPILYRLPEVRQAVKAGETVFIVEGEKDTDNVAILGLTATTNPGGAGSWCDSFSEELRGARVVILIDNDEPGRKHGEAVAASLHGKATSVKVLKLPGLPEKGDVTDWLEAGGTRAELERLITEAPEWGPPKAPEGLDEGEPRALTDLGNAERLKDRHGKNIRYVPPWNKWLLWSGRHFEVDDLGRVHQLAKETVRSIYAEAAEADSHDRREAVAKHAVRSESENRIRAMVNLARTEPGIPVRAEDLDRDPWLLNVANGTLDLRTGELRPHRRADLITKVLPTDYDPGAEAPLWERFLAEIMAGSDSRVKFLQRAAGYSLTGLTIEQIIFIMFGVGANGKSVFITTLMNLLDAYAKSFEPEVLMLRRNEAHPTERADLMGTRLAATTETGEGQRLNEALIKRLTGGEPIRARFMRQDSFEFEPTHKLWMATNHQPIIRGTDTGIWRRLHLIPFAVTIPEDEQDPFLAEKLKDEFPGILRWAVEGCLAWQKEGLNPPDEVLAATQEYRADMDVLGTFLDDCCDIGPEHWESAANLYKAYSDWCKNTGEYTLSHTAFGTRLRDRGFVSSKVGGIRGRQGLRVKEAVKDEWAAYSSVASL